MNKKLTVILTMLICLFYGTVNATENLIPVEMGYQQFKVNGNLSNVVTYNIEDESYFRIRDIAFSLKNTNKKFDTIYDAQKNQINLIKGIGYSVEETVVVFNDEAEAVEFTGSICVENIALPIKGYNIEGYNYYKISDVAKVLDFNANYDTVGKLLNINTTKDFKGIEKKIAL